MKTIMMKDETKKNPYKELMEAIKNTKEENIKVDSYNFSLNDFDEEGNIKK
jgi:hypothetical protein